MKCDQFVFLLMWLAASATLEQTASSEGDAKGSTYRANCQAGMERFLGRSLPVIKGKP